MQYHKDYCLPFDEISISRQDVLLIKSEMRDHDNKRFLDYQTFFGNKKILRTDFANDLKIFAKKYDTKLATLAALTANPGVTVPIHVDGDLDSYNQWRLTFYTEGEPGIISWYNGNSKPVYSSESKAYRYDNFDGNVVFSTILDANSAFIRTSVPHSLDLSNTKTPRLTITATFSPNISWDKLSKDYYETIRSN